MQYSRNGRNVNEALDKDDGDDDSIEEESHAVSIQECSPEPLPEGIHSVAIACTVKDVARSVRKGHWTSLRLGRTCITNMLVVMVMVLQFFLIWQTKHLVSPHAVASIREIYDKYERMMYTDGQSVQHIYLTKHGNARGSDTKYFNSSRFTLMDKEERDAVCRFPLSQPAFLVIILVIWTLTCFSEIRETIDMMNRLMIGTPTVATMALALDRQDDDSGTIVGLTWSMKLYIVLCVLIPRVFMTIFLLWLGSRWLTATIGFGNVLLNAVALEFILMLRELLYLTVLPTRLQKEHELVLVNFPKKNEPATCCTYFGMFLAAVVVVGWVLLYICFLQQVLPDYKWDVHSTCVDYLARQLKV